MERMKMSLSNDAWDIHRPELKLNVSSISDLRSGDKPSTIRTQNLLFRDLELKF